MEDTKPMWRRRRRRRRLGSGRRKRGRCHPGGKSKTAPPAHQHHRLYKYQ